MTKTNPIIAVKDVDRSAKWYETIFDFKNTSPKGHGFAVLKNESDEIVLCLHSWEISRPSKLTFVLRQFGKVRKIE